AHWGVNEAGRWGTNSGHRRTRESAPPPPASCGQFGCQGRWHIAKGFRDAAPTARQGQKPRIGTPEVVVDFDDASMRRLANYETVETPRGLVTDTDRRERPRDESGWIPLGWDDFEPRSFQSLKPGRDHDRCDDREASEDNPKVHRAHLSHSHSHSWLSSAAIRRLDVGPDMVGVAGFEPAASSSRTKRAAKLRYTPVDRSRSLADRARWRAPDNPCG